MVQWRKLLHELITLQLYLHSCHSRTMGLLADPQTHQAPFCSRPLHMLFSLPGKQFPQPRGTLSPKLQYRLHHLVFFILFKEVLFIYLFIYLSIYRQRGREGRQRERNIHVWLPLMHPLLGSGPTTQTRALTGNQTGDSLVRSPVLNPLSHNSQGHSLFLSITLTAF